MGRRPCCEKMGLKKGPWSAEEDRILISHIRLHGHPNWRALPQLAGKYFHIFIYFLTYLQKTETLISSDLTSVLVL